MDLFTKKKYVIYFDYESCDDVKYRDLRSKELTFCTDDLLHAIVTCGMPIYYCRTRSAVIRRKDELVYKIAAIQFALDEQPDPKDSSRNVLVLSDRLRYLDPSEKGVLSYYIGMFFTKLISKKIFHVQYLVHLSIAQMIYSIILEEKGRPDLIGYNLRSGDYSVFEAKGRARYSEKTLDDACGQVQMVKYICGDKPSLRVANLMYFRKKDKIKKVLQSSIKDPEGAEGISIDFPPEKILRQYYQPICELINEIRDAAASDHSLSQNPYSARFLLPGQHSVTITLPSVVYNMFSDEFSQFNMEEMKEYVMGREEDDDLVQIEFE